MTDVPAGEVPGPEFVQAFTRNQRRIYLYILALVANPVDAEEVLQDANIIIWSKFGQFQPGTNFLAWASQIAYFEVLKYRDRRRRDRHFFNDELLQLIAEEAVEQADALEQRRAALVTCLGKLKPADRELVQLRYGAGADGQSVADQLGRPVNSIYQSLGRIRKMLLECINRRVAAETRS